MPVFGKKKPPSTRWKRLKAKVRHPFQRLDVRPLTLAKQQALNKRVFRPEFKRRETKFFSAPLFERTGLSVPEVERETRFGLSNWIQNRCQQQGTSAPIRIVDWGCGNGATITELCQKFGPQIEGFGVANQSHSAWAKNRFATFIMETEKKLHRYFKPNTVDLVFSESGLRQLDVLDRMKTIENWVPRLKKGGILVYGTNVNSEDIPLLERTRRNLATAGIQIRIDSKTNERILIERLQF